jgi:VPS55-like protein
MGRELVVIVVLALFLASGLFLTAFACVNGETWWPLVPLIMATFSLVFFFGTGLAETASRADDYGRTEEDLNCIAFGWFIFGAIVTATFGMPLLLAWARIVPINISWEACAGTWSFVAAVATACILMMKTDESQ